MITINGKLNKAISYTLTFPSIAAAATAEIKQNVNTEATEIKQNAKQNVNVTITKIKQNVNVTTRKIPLIMQDFSNITSLEFMLFVYSNLTRVECINLATIMLQDMRCYIR